MATTITANGINFPDGSAGSPSIGGTDTNTGLFTGSDIIGFSTGGSERLRIDASGRLLLGTTTEGHASADNLTINEASGNGGMTIRTDASSAGAVYFSDATSGGGEYNGYVQYDHNLNALQLGTVGSERLRIDSSGRVGIGVTSFHDSSTRLQLQATGSDHTGIVVTAAGTSSLAYLYMGDTDDKDIGRLVYDNSTNAMQMWTDNAERLRIDSSGNVGVGTTSPAKNLHVYDSGVSYLRLETGAANGQAWDFLSTYGGSANTGTLSIRNESGSSFLDLQENGGSPRTTIANGGSVQFQFDADGIKFNGDTAAANGLDDYEEGTWSPGIDKNASSMSCSYSHSTGTYTRIGRLVMVWFDFQVSATSNSGSGAPYITELPFTALYGSGGGSNNGGYGAPTFRDATLVNSDFRVYGTSSYIANKQIYLQHYNSSGSATQTTLNSTGRLTGQAFYFAT